MTHFWNTYFVFNVLFSCVHIFDFSSIFCKTFQGLRRDHPALYCRSLVLTDEHWIVEKPKELLETPLFKCQVRYMHGKPLKDCHLVDLPDSDMILLDVDEPLYAVAPGQVKLKKKKNFFFFNNWR